MKLSALLVEHGKDAVRQGERGDEHVLHVLLEERVVRSAIDLHHPLLFAGDCIARHHAAAALVTGVELVRRLVAEHAVAHGRNVDGRDTPGHASPATTTNMPATTARRDEHMTKTTIQPPLARRVASVAEFTWSRSRRCPTKRAARNAIAMMVS